MTNPVIASHRGSEARQSRPSKTSLRRRQFQRPIAVEDISPLGPLSVDGEGMPAGRGEVVPPIVHQADHSVLAEGAFPDREHE
jgi:hypothetical protein